MFPTHEAERATARAGVLRAEAYCDGKLVATTEHATAGEPAALELTAVEQSIRADRTGVAHIEVTVTDAEGRYVPHANPLVTFEVDGPARLIGLENGDPLDTSNYKLDHRSAFHGRLLAIVQATDAEGTINVIARTPDSESGYRS